MAKRANGEGTIRKRSDGRWEARYFDTASESQKSIYGKTQKEVREKLSEITVEKDKLTYISPTQLTVGEWFQVFIDKYKTGFIKPQSVAMIKSNYRCHIAKYIGDKPIQKVTTDDVTRILKEESAACNKGTVNLIKTYLNEIFIQARKCKLIKLNPVTEAIVPENQNPDRKKRELMEDELYWFFRGLIEHRPKDFLFFLVLASTGMRCGEGASLKWEDVTKDFSYINIKTTNVRYYDNGKSIDTENSPKSRNGIRGIPIKQEIIPLLKKHKERAKFIADQFGREFSESDYIFITAKTNKPIAVSTFEYSITAVCNYLKSEYNLEVEDFSTHYFRHTFATRAVRGSVPLETLRNLLGHSTYEQVLKYTHSNKNDEVAAINKIFAKPAVC